MRLRSSLLNMLFVIIPFNASNFPAHFISTKTEVEVHTKSGIQHNLHNAPVCVRCVVGAYVPMGFKLYKYNTRVSKEYFEERRDISNSKTRTDQQTTIIDEMKIVPS